MAGAMAGSAILAALDKSDRLEIVTLTINNLCNLSCPHCYLQYGIPTRALIEWRDVEHILESGFRHLSIVGKEPLANRASVKLLTQLVGATAASGRTSSFITNGLNLCLLDSATLSQLAWVDVSLDGGPDEYAGYRGGSFARLSEGIHYARDHGLGDLRILQTISSGNIAATEAALHAAVDFGASHVIVSPFQATRQEGRQCVDMVGPTELLDALEKAGAHLDPRIWLTLDSGYIGAFGGNGVVARASSLFANRFIYVESDPIDRGIIRVTFDGLVLSPFESVHTSDYRRIGRPLLSRPLHDWHADILTSRVALEGVGIAAHVQ